MARHNATTATHNPALPHHRHTASVRADVFVSQPPHILPTVAPAVAGLVHEPHPHKLVLQAVLRHGGRNVLVVAAHLVRWIRTAGLAEAVQHRLVDVAARDVGAVVRAGVEDAARADKRVHDKHATRHFAHVGGDDGQLGVHRRVANQIAVLEIHAVDQLPRATRNLLPRAQ